MNHERWQAVHSFAMAGPFPALDIALYEADPAIERFESDAGGRALLVPVIGLASGKAARMSIRDVPSEISEILFVDPQHGDSAVALLVALGDRAGSIRVALPDHADPNGLIPDDGAVTFVSASSGPVTCRLFRAAERQFSGLEPPAELPKLGEAEDVLERRAKWFGGREGETD